MANAPTITTVTLPTALAKGQSLTITNSTFSNGNIVIASAIPTWVSPVDGFYKTLPNSHISVHLYKFFDIQYMYGINVKTEIDVFSHPLFYEIRNFQTNVFDNCDKMFTYTLAGLNAKLERFMVDNGINYLDEVNDDILLLLKLTVLN